MYAAIYGKADIIKVLLDAGAAIEVEDNVSKRISICICVCVYVCVCVLYSCIIVYDMSKVLFYSLLLFYYCDV